MIVKVFILHNRCQLRGGENESTDLEVAVLHARGHMVEFLQVDNRAIAGWQAWRAGLQAEILQECVRTVPPL